MKGLALGDFRLSVQARRVAVRYPQDMRLVVDADLVATSLSGSNIVRGEVVLQRGTYSKDIELTISDLLSRGRPAGAVLAQEPWKERTALEIRIVSAAALEVRNNVARLTATVDLLARGSLAAPTLVGQIVLDEGGRITFRDVRYEIESGTIAFANTEGFEPIIDIRVRAEVKGYDVGVSLVGTWPRIQTSLSSDPPLPDELIVGLLGVPAFLYFKPVRSTGAGAPINVVPLTTYPGRESQPAFSPDGNQIAFVWSGAKDDNTDVYVRLVDGGNWVRLTDDPGDDVNPVWSPDGRTIAFYRSSPDGDGIFLVPALGG